MALLWLLCALVTACYQTTGLPTMVEGYDYRIHEINQHFTPLQQEMPVSGSETPFQGAEQPYDYMIGAGDVIRLTVSVIDPSGENGLVRVIPQSQSSPVSSENLFLVAANGHAEIPYIGAVPFAGKTVTQLRSLLDRKLRQYFKNPQLELAVQEYAHGRAMITGEVENPKELFLSQTPLTVMQALERVGGLTDSADRSAAILRHANGREEAIDLNALIYEGQTRYNQTLNAGDTLHIPRNKGNKIFVTGEVSNPKAVIMQRDSVTLTEVLDEVKGIVAPTADPTAIYVLREDVSALTDREEEQPVKVAIFHLDASDPRAYIYGDKFRMQPRDVVFVGSRNITDWSRFISQLLPGGIAAGLVQPAPYVMN